MLSFTLVSCNVLMLQHEKCIEFDQTLSSGKGLACETIHIVVLIFLHLALYFRVL